MTLVQNYIGLDARIYAIVKSLLNGESVDLSNYYTKEEVDALIASGGSGTTIDYNSLLNRPIINGLLQRNLDLNNNSLLNNGKQLYLPSIADNIITFDSDCVIPNIYNKSEVYTKAECDEKFSGGGGGTTDYNQLTNKPIDNYVLQNNLDCGAHDLTNINNIYTKSEVYTKAECDGKFSNYMTIESLRLLGIPSYLGAMADYTYMMFHSCTGIYLARNFVIEFAGMFHANSLGIEWCNEYGNPYNTTNLINIYKDRIESQINATFPNIYTKTEVDQKIAEAGDGLLIKGADTDGTPESINAEINNTPDGFAKMFKSNYGGSYQMQTIFTVKLDTSRIFSLMFPKGSNLFRFQTAPNGTWYTIQSATSASQTITHEAPYVGDADEYTIGDPVFASGRVCKYDMDNNTWLYQTGPTDCICEVKAEGTVGEYVGICVGFKEDQHTLLFATHGDFYFNVADSSKYKTGDIVLVDGSVLADDTPITGKITKMIVGRVTGKINKTTIAVLRD